MLSFITCVVVLLSYFSRIAKAQLPASADDGYTGYKLEYKNNDKRDVVYETADTAANVRVLLHWYSLSRKQSSD